MRGRPAVAAARAAVVAGFVGTSDLEAARTYGIRPIGTAAHSFTLLHDGEEAAFDARVAALGPGTTLLVDTYDVPRGVERAVAAARRAGGELGAVRLGSGDLVAQAFTVRRQLRRPRRHLHAHHPPSPRTSASTRLPRSALPRRSDAYGVGTKLVTGSGHPTAELVYKLVAREGADGSLEPVQKESTSKKSVGGRKFAGRVLEDGRAAEELAVATDDAALAAAYLAAHNARPLQVEMVRDGVVDESQRGVDALRAATERHIASRAELPHPAWRLSERDPALTTRHVAI